MIWACAKYSFTWYAQFFLFWIRSCSFVKVKCDSQTYATYRRDLAVWQVQTDYFCALEVFQVTALVFHITGGIWV